jgi:hypothetical protein
MKNQRQQQFIYLMEEQWQGIIPAYCSAPAKVFITMDFPSPTQTNGKQ